MTTLKTIHKSDREFKSWLDQFCKKYRGVIRELGRGNYRVATDKEVKSKFTELDKRYSGLYDDLAKTHSIRLTRSQSG